MATKPASKTAAPKTAALTKDDTKPAKTSVAVRKPSAGNVVSIKEALQAQAAAMAGRIMPATGNAIRITQDKHFVLPNGIKTRESLQLVILDFCAVNNFYDGPYDKDNIKPPACFAIGLDPRNLTPSKNSPNKQADSCQGCPLNEFGSEGAGKACKNGRKLAVMPPEADEDTPIWTLSVSPTALKAFDGFVSQVTRLLGVPPIGVVVTVGFDESTDFPKLMFSDPVPNEYLATHYARQEEARELLTVEPDVSQYEAPSNSRRSNPPKKTANGRR